MVFILCLSEAEFRIGVKSVRSSTDTVIAIMLMPATLEGQPNVRRPEALPGVRREIEAIIEAAPFSINTTTILHPSPDQVEDILQQSHVAHFACHGVSDSVDPSHSGLILQRTGSDGSPEQDFLSVHRVSESRLECAQIAYLSACSAAENKAAQLADEVIHAVSGFQVVGFPHVVGRLWPAGDSGYVEIAREFYRSIIVQSQVGTREREWRWRCRKL